MEENQSEEHLYQRQTICSSFLKVYAWEKGNSRLVFALFYFLSEFCRCKDDAYRLQPSTLKAAEASVCLAESLVFRERAPFCKNLQHNPLIISGKQHWKQLDVAQVLFPSSERNTKEAKTILQKNLECSEVLSSEISSRECFRSRKQFGPPLHT